MNQPMKMPSRKVGIEPIMPPERVGSLYVPDMAQGRCKSGIVKYVADDCVYVKVGDYVLFGGYTGTWVAMEDETVLIMHEDFIQSVISNENIVIPGLYAKTTEGEYIPVPYETVFKFVRDALADTIDGNVQVTKEALLDSRDKGDWEKRK